PGRPTRREYRGRRAAEIRVETRGPDRDKSRYRNRRRVHRSPRCTGCPSGRGECGGRSEDRVRAKFLVFGAAAGRAPISAQDGKDSIALSILIRRGWRHPLYLHRLIRRRRAGHPDGQTEWAGKLQIELDVGKQRIRQLILEAREGLTQGHYGVEIDSRRGRF